MANATPVNKAAEAAVASAPIAPVAAPEPISSEMAELKAKLAAAEAALAAASVKAAVPVPATDAALQSQFDEAVAAGKTAILLPRALRIDN